MYDMPDEEFLNYCESHSETPRCGFVPDHIVRLASLAKKPALAALWKPLPNGVYSFEEDQIKELVRKARENLSSINESGPVQ